MISRYLFLDCDGVINKIADFDKQLNLYPVDKRCCELIKKLVIDVRCKIVFTSAWRLDHRSNCGWQKAVKQIGLLTDDLGVPPFVSNQGTREQQIEQYLDDLRTRRIAVDKYAIVDDEDCYTNPLFRKHLVLTNKIFGITDSDIVRLQEILL